MKELLIQSGGASPALALTQDRRLVEYWELEEDLALGAGAIYLGKVGRVMKALKAVFVFLAPGVEGFLPFDELPGHHQPQAGESLLVQIKKPAQGGKAAYLTGDLAFPGRYAMLLPRGDRAGASGRAKSPKELRQLAARLCPKGMGLVLRARAEGADEAQILAEISHQQALYEGLVSLSARLSAPALLQKAPGAAQRLLRDEGLLPQRVVCDDEKAARGLGLPVFIQEDPFALYGVRQQLHQALKRRVYLPSGGFLVLDPCEAALVIDVNSGQDARKTGDLGLKVNLEAAVEIPRLLRLRRAGGIILIDFIDLPSKEARARVQETLVNALKEDSVRSEVLGFTRLGLMEMTRKKAHAPLPAQGPEAGQEPDLEDAYA